MRIRYTISRWDIWAAQMRLALNNRFLFVVWIVCGCVVGVAWFPRESVQQGSLSAGAAIIVALFLGGLFDIFAALLAFGVVGLNILVKPNRGVLGEHTLEVSDEGLVESTTTNRSVHLWHGIRRIRQGTKWVFIWVTDSNFHVIPRARIEEGDLSAFMNEVEQKAKTSQ